MKTLALSLLVLPLAAQSEATGHRFGLSLGVAPTVGQIRDFYDKARLDLGVHYIYGMDNGHALRASAHVLFSQESTTTTKNLDTKRSMPGSQILAEYLYYVQGKTGEGLYLSGGLGVASEQCRADRAGVLTKNNVSTVVPTLGLGYDFTRNLGASLRYVHGAAEPKDPVLTFDPKKPTVGTLSAAFRYTF